MAKDKKVKAAKKKEKPPKTKRKKILRSEYEKAKKQQINYLLNDEKDLETSDKKKKNNVFKRLFGIFKSENGDDKLMLVRANPSELPEGARLGFSMPYTLIVEVVSIILLMVYIGILFSSVNIHGSVSMVNLIFVIVAHFMLTVTVANIDVRAAGLNYTLSKTILAVFQWVCSLAILLTMHRISAESMGAAIAMQTTLVIFVVAVGMLLSTYKRYELAAIDRRTEELALARLGAQSEQTADEPIEQGA